MILQSRASISRTLKVGSSSQDMKILRTTQRYTFGSSMTNHKLSNMAMSQHTFRHHLGGCTILMTVLNLYLPHNLRKYSSMAKACLDHLPAPRAREAQVHTQDLVGVALLLNMLAPSYVAVMSASWAASKKPMPTRTLSAIATEEPTLSQVLVNLGARILQERKLAPKIFWKVDGERGPSSKAR